MQAITKNMIDHEDEKHGVGWLLGGLTYTERTVANMVAVHHRTDSPSNQPPVVQRNRCITGGKVIPK